MKALVRILLASLLAFSALGAHAQRIYAPGELESLLAPIALYPDPLLSQILDASQYPQDVATAAAWARANPQLSGDAALATVQSTAWAPSVKALAATPDVLTRMADSPQWLQELGQAYASQGANLMATVQELRARAQASGYLESNDQQSVVQQGQAIIVQPASPNVIYAPWYDPFVVYGGWGWGFRPVFFRPFVSRPVFVTHVFVAPRFPRHVHGPVRVVPRAVPVAPHAFVPRGHVIVQGGPVVVRPFRAVPESQRQPFIHSSGSAFIHGAMDIHGAPVARARIGASFAASGTSGGHHGGGHGHRR